MLKGASGALLTALALMAVGCNGEDDNGQAEDSARRSATSVANRAEAATRLTATLTGPVETPTPGDPNGTGTASVNLDVSKGEVCYQVSTQKIDRPSAMHIHEGEAGKSGAPVLTLATPTAPESTTNGCAKAAALIGRLAANPGGFYVNVHTASYPDGAVRGQLSQ